MCKYLNNKTECSKLKSKKDRRHFIILDLNTRIYKKVYNGQKTFHCASYFCIAGVCKARVKSRLLETRLL